MARRVGTTGDENRSLRVVPDLKVIEAEEQVVAPHREVSTNEADASVEDFIDQSKQNFVRARSPQIEELARAVTAAGGITRPEEDGALAISGLPIGAVGDLARDAGIAVHELSPQLASLEEAFMELTRDSVEFRATAVMETR